MNDQEKDLSLESILAEYKSTAIIAGDRKTPKDVLNAKADEILHETLTKIREQATAPSSPSVPPTVPPPTKAPQTEHVPSEQVRPVAETVLEPERAVPAEGTTTTLPVVARQKMEPGKVIELSVSGVSGGQVLKQAGAEQVDTPQVESAEFVDTDVYADNATIEEFAHIHEALSDAMDDEDETDSFLTRLAFWRRGRRDVDEADELPPDAPEEEGVYDTADFDKDELTLLQAAGKYGRGIASYQIRGVCTCLLALVMLMLTGFGDGGFAFTGFLGTVRGFAAMLIILQLFAMVLSAEVVATGILDMIRGRFGVESLVVISALAAIGDALVVMHAGFEGRGFPYSAVVAFALGAALLGIKSTRDAMKTTLRTAATKKEPYVVMSHLGALDEGFVIYKAKIDTEGFVKKTEQMDFSEYVYRMAAPLLLVISVVFAALSTLGRGGGMVEMLHHFSAMAVVAASFTGLMAYGTPYMLLSRKLSKIGAALSGWGGAAEVKEARNLIVTDADVFPVGTLSLGGLKIIREEERARVIACTASLVIASGSGLVDLFSDLQRKENLPMYAVEGLVSYEGGGVGAKIQGREVVVGSVSLMNLMGIRLPQNLNVKNAVFTSIDGELLGVFAVNYTPLNSVKEALISLLGAKIRPLFAVRDFNITPIMLQNKFQISTDKINFLTYAERYSLSALEPDRRAKPFAVFAREGLGPLTDVVVGGKRLRSTVVRNTMLSLASSVIGLLLLLSFFWADAPQTASAVNVFYYLAAWLFVMHVLSRTVTLD